MKTGIFYKVKKIGGFQLFKGGQQRQARRQNEDKKEVVCLREVSGGQLGDRMKTGIFYKVKKIGGF